MRKKIIYLATSLLAVISLNTQAEMRPGALEIWTTKGAQTLNTMAQEFSQATGIEVVVSSPADMAGLFQTVAPNGGGPDLIMWAHDRSGDWAEAGLIKAIPDSDKLRQSQLPMAIEAFDAEGKLYAWPMVLETISLIYNKRFVQAPPSSFEEMFELDQQLQQQQGVQAIVWDYNNSYYTWPLLAAAGSDPFVKTASGYDTSKTQINSASAKYALKLIKKMIDDGLMHKGIDYSIMNAMFHKEQAAMVLSGPWYWQGLDEAGMDYGLAPLPSVDGHPARPFVGVHGFMLNANSPNADLVVEFMENFLLQPEQLARYHSDGNVGLSTQQQLSEKMIAEDPRMLATLNNAEQGVLMPSVPKMGKFWSASAAAITNATSGRLAPEKALDMAAKRLVK